MACSIYYPQSACSFRDITQRFCPESDSPEGFANTLLRINPQTANLDVRTAPHRPVLIPDSAHVPSISLNELMCCPPEQQATLSQFAQYAGGAAVAGLANLLWDTRIPEAVSDLNTFGGNGMGAALANSSAILGSINEYDLTNKHYEDLKNHRASPRMVQAAKLRAEAAFRKMNQVFGMKSVNYLNTNTFNTRPAVNAAGRQVWESIPVRDTLDVQKLASFAKGARILSPGFILLDGYLRANAVYHMRRNGDPEWKKEAWVQTGSFAVGLAVGAGIGLAVAFTSAGLLIAIVAGGAAGLGVDYGSRAFLRTTYEKLAR